MHTFTPIMNFFRTYLPFYKRNLKVAIPVIITQTGQVIVQVVDNIMVGHLGAGQLAGASFANAVFIVSLIFLIGFAQGITPLAGQSYGKGDHSTVSRLFGNAIIIDIALGTILTILMIGVGFALPYMGQDPAVLFYSKQYYYIILSSLIPASIFFGIRFFSEGIGNTKNAMIITIGLNVLNIILNWVLIYGHLGFPKMGVAGAATSTLTCRVLAAIAFIIILFKSPVYKPFIAKITKPLIRKKDSILILKTSFPISLQSLGESLAFSLAAIMVGWIGAKELAAHQITQNLSHITFMVALGIGAACTIRVSHQYGAGNYHEMMMAGKASIHMSVAIMSLFGFLYIIFRNYIPYIYTNNLAVIDIASELMVIMCMYQIFDAIQLASISALRGLKDITIPLLYSLFSYYIICLPTGYLLAHVLGYGPKGLWIGLMLGLAFNSIFFYLRFIKLSRKIISESENK